MKICNKSRGVNNICSCLLTISMLLSLILSGCSTQAVDNNINVSENETTAAKETTAVNAETISSNKKVMSAKNNSGITDGTVNLYLIRHGKTIMNTYELCQGWSDSPLTAEGIKVAQNVGTGLSDIIFDHAYASDSQRAIETGDIIMSANKVSDDLQMVTMTGLREISFGGFEGRPNEGMREAIQNYYGVEDLNAVADLVGTPQIFSAMSEVDPEGIAETHEEIVLRLKEAFQTITSEAEADGGGNVLVFGHGVSLLVAIGELTGIQELPASGLANASVTKIVYKDGQYTLEYVNNMEFAETGEAIRSEQEKPVTIYLTRHGKTQFNTLGQTQGWIDSMLAEEGREVAVQLGKGLADVEFDAVYTSGLGRTIETAKLVLAENKNSSGLPIKNIVGLREANYGKYEGGYISDLNQAMFEYYGISSADELATADQTLLERFLYYTSSTDESGNAENVFELKARVRTALDQVVGECTENGDEEVLVVAHGNAIMAVLETLGVEGVTSISNSSVTKIIYENGEYTVDSVNDMSYVEVGSVN